ncbi:YidH family protein [Oricola cellulosilytica]|uniref:DUF202 domain-containing protein n=1 Tax=Oricola cellulosilytica TaxID=1429082 RepID=A0A4R0PER2_9HYPH|nr:DUF202 domain-containing protein [Oricola cellulosilytica]TCD13863.1 DUF202 domain-containing protein [Oricola cellulosilytica]
MSSEQPTSQELAEDRTEWAEDRTILANERTFAGWMRTGLAAVGVGLGFQAVFRATEPTWVAKLGATVFILIGIAIFLTARRRACAVLDRLNSHAAEPAKDRTFGLMALAFSTGSVLLGAVVWLFL